MTARAITAPSTTPTRTINYNVEAGEYMLTIYGRGYWIEQLVSVGHCGSLNISLRTDECADLKRKEK